MRIPSICLALLAVVAGCTDDRIVFRDRAPFNAPADTASGFLGYYTVSSKQTTCGNCHATFQASWKETKHASAWQNLQANAGAAESCRGCHTTNGRGNSLVSQTAGYDKVSDSTYHDVQCESCHGPGLEHVAGVGEGSIVRPLAKIGMTGAGNCADCHSGAHHPFADEWKLSGHATVSASRASNPSCAGCHDGRAALVRWGEDANFEEKGGATNYQATTCAVCHDPHGSENPGQLRFPVTSGDPELNLCMKCHLRRDEPEVTASTPHAPQGGVLLGMAGYRPPGFVYDTARIFGSHATTLNQKLCAGCHVSKFTVNDAITGAFTFQATGHLMRPIPCLDAAGKPTADKTCAYSTTARSWKSCAQAGCHASEAVAQTAFTTVRNRMKFFTDQLWLNTDGDGTIDAAPVDGGLLATIKQTRPLEFSTTDNQITPAEGAEFNARLCGEYNQSNSDNSKGIHNPFLCEALLQATITYVKSFYGLASPAGMHASFPAPLSETFQGSMHISRTKPGR